MEGLRRAPNLVPSADRPTPCRPNSGLRPLGKCPLRATEVHRRSTLPLMSLPELPRVRSHPDTDTLKGRNTAPRTIERPRWRLRSEAGQVRDQHWPLHKAASCRRCWPTSPCRRWMSISATDLLGPYIRVRIGCLSGDITWRSAVLDHAGGSSYRNGVSRESGRGRPPDLADQLRRAPPASPPPAPMPWPGPRTGPSPVLDERVNSQMLPGVALHPPGPYTADQRRPFTSQAKSVLHPGEPGDHPCREGRPERAMDAVSALGVDFHLRVCL